MKKVALAAFALAISACYPTMRPHAFSAQPIPCKMDVKDAVTHVSRAVVNADLAVEQADPNTGIVRTDWASSGMAVVLDAQVQRRVRFSIIADGNTIHIKPQAQSKSQDTTIKGDWTDDPRGISAREQAVYDKLEQALKAELGTSAAATAPAAPAASATPAASN